MSTPADSFGKMVINECWQVVKWHAAKAAGKMPAWRAGKIPLITARKWLQEAEIVGVNTHAVWAAFQAGLQEGRQDGRLD